MIARRQNRTDRWNGKEFEFKARRKPNYAYEDALVKYIAPCCGELLGWAGRSDTGKFPIWDEYQFTCKCGRTLTFKLALHVEAVHE